MQSPPRLQRVRHLAVQTPPCQQRAPHLDLQTPPRLQRAPHLGGAEVAQAAAGTLSSRADAALPAAAGTPPGRADAAPAAACTPPGLADAVPYGRGCPAPLVPARPKGSPGPPYVQLHDLPAAGRRRGEAAAVPARHVCGRSRGRSQERRVGGRSTHGAPSLPRRPGSHPLPRCLPPGLRLSWLQATGPARPLLRARSPPWRTPQPSGGRVAAWDKTAQCGRLPATEWSGRSQREGGDPDGRRVWEGGSSAAVARGKIP